MSRRARFSRHWLWLLFALPIALGLWRLRLDVEILNLLPPSSPAVQGLKLYQENFANARELIITVRTSDAGQAESAARAVANGLRRATNLVASAAWQPPWIERPGESAELIAFLWLNQPPVIFAEITNRLTDAAMATSLAEAREQLNTGLSPDSFALRGYDPFNLTRLPGAVTADAPSFTSGQEFFASAEGTFRIIFVEAARDLAGYRACIKWLAEVKAIVERTRVAEGVPADVAVGYTGRPAFVAEIAGGMESDMAGPSAGTLAVIALLFYFVHRRWRPLFWLVTLLILILAGTLALGALAYGSLNVVSLGFASILLGLAEDFGIVLYQESRSHPLSSLADIRRLAAPGILWSALTTAGAFLLLNLSSIPGLRQLGTLVAIGVAVAAVVMLSAYLPPLLGRREDETSGSHETPSSVNSSSNERRSWFLTALIGGGALVFLVVHPPTFDQSTESLRPKHSAAYAALDEMKHGLGLSQEPLWLMIPGRDESEVSRRLSVVRPILDRAQTDGLVSTVTLPTQLWPTPESQTANRSALAALLGRHGALRDAAFRVGFTSNSLALTENLFASWQRAADSSGVFWPTNEASQWVLDKVTAQPGRRTGLQLPLNWSGAAPPELLALGLIYPPTNAAPKLAELNQRLAGSGALLSGWLALGGEVFELVKRDLPRVLVPMAVLLLVTLWLAFRSMRDVGLSLANLLAAGLLLHVVMRMAGWSWNLMNLMALPLLLGMGVDFSIHVQLALRRYHGDLRRVRGSVGRALLLAGSTTVAGFASLAFASNAGIASLGKVCAAGIACAMLTAVYLLPVWWSAAASKDVPRATPEA